MSLSLNHVAVRTADLEASRRFYVDVLGLVVGPRPDFPFPGLWLYTGDSSAPADAAVHLIGVAAAGGDGLAAYLGERAAGGPAGHGALDHVAFFATGLDSMRERLARLGIAARERTVPGLGLHQLFVDDPNGLVIELNYPAREAGRPDTDSR